MTIQYPAVAICPFCEGGLNEIHFNTVAFEAWCGWHEDGDIPRNLVEEAGQKIILYDRDDPCPCEHLVQLSIGLQGGVIENQDWMTRAAVDFDWIHPLLKAGDVYDGAIAYLWDQAPMGDESEIDGLVISHRVNDVCVEGPSMNTGRDGDMCFAVYGNVAFAEDVRAFLEELKTANDAVWLVS